MNSLNSNRLEFSLFKSKSLSSLSFFEGGMAAKNLVRKLRENPTGVVLLLKKRPRVPSTSLLPRKTYGGGRLVQVLLLVESLSLTLKKKKDYGLIGFGSVWIICVQIIIL